MKSLIYIKIVDGKYQLKSKYAYYGQVQLGMVINDNVTIEVLFDTQLTENMLISLKNVYFCKMIHNIPMYVEKVINLFVYKNYKLNLYKKF